MAAKKVVQKFISPIEDFLHTESSSGIILMICALVALLWANSSAYESYEYFINLPIGLSIGGLAIEKSFHHWVNDGLMVIFFFVVGLEIKRELILGELSNPKKAALPMFAALGGMVVPAALYTAFNYGTVAHTGWGIPMATDIAFALGVLALLGRRAPFALKIFLLALAIVDDLGAVLVIAFFYTENIAKLYLGLSALTFGLTYMFKSTGLRNYLVYWVLGIFAWFCVLKSGVHSTIAGVVLGLLTPLNTYIPKNNLAVKLSEILGEIVNDLKTVEPESQRVTHSTEQKIRKLKQTTNDSISPLDHLIHGLHPWVSFVIMPVFAFTNAGVRIEGIDLNSFLTNPVSLGIIFGLFLGKPIGVLLFSFFAVKMNLARLPRGVNWYHMIGVGFLAGIGFTMALFISHLALGGNIYETYSKLGILCASVIAGICGSAFLLIQKQSPE